MPLIAGRYDVPPIVAVRYALSFPCSSPGSSCRGTAHGLETAATAGELIRPQVRVRKAAGPIEETSSEDRFRNGVPDVQIVDPVAHVFRCRIHFY
jgi:hypothetical protein